MVYASQSQTSASLQHAKSHCKPLCLPASPTELPQEGFTSLGVCLSWPRKREVETKGGLSAQQPGSEFSNGGESIFHPPPLWGKEGEPTL